MTDKISDDWWPFFGFGPDDPQVTPLVDTINRNRHLWSQDRIDAAWAQFDGLCVRRETGDLI